MPLPIPMPAVERPMTPEERRYAQALEGLNRYAETLGPGNPYFQQLLGNLLSGGEPAYSPIIDQQPLGYGDTHQTAPGGANPFDFHGTDLQAQMQLAAFAPPSVTPSTNPLVQGASAIVGAAKNFITKETSPPAYFMKPGSNVLPDNYTKGVNSQLVSIMQQASNEFAAQNPGYRVEFTSGRTGRSYTSNHPNGLALDVQIIDPSGKPLYNEPLGGGWPKTLRGPQIAETFSTYQSLANIAKQIQTEQFPALDSKFAWGGYFGFDSHGRNAMDLMHFDITKARGSFGNFKTGLTPAALKLLGGSVVPFTPGNPTAVANGASPSDVLASNKSTITRNSSPERIAALQTSLQQAGFNPGPIDGKWGSKTKAAVQNFQLTNGLTVDGRPGPQTIGQLVSATQSFAGNLPQARPVITPEMLAQVPGFQPITAPQLPPALAGTGQAMPTAPFENQATGGLPGQPSGSNLPMPVSGFENQPIGGTPPMVADSGYPMPSYGFENQQTVSTFPTPVDSGYAMPIAAFENNSNPPIDESQGFAPYYPAEVPQGQNNPTVNDLLSGNFWSDFGSKLVNGGEPPAPSAPSIYGAGDIGTQPGLSAPYPSDPYETQLTPSEEQQFQAWKATYAPNDSGFDYDLRGAFKAGLTPDPVSGHWPDTFKKPNEPTFSTQSQYMPMAPERAGSWVGAPDYSTYVPPDPTEYAREAQRASAYGGTDLSALATPNVINPEAMLPANDPAAQGGVGSDYAASLGGSNSYDHPVDFSQGFASHYPPETPDNNPTLSDFLNGSIFTKLLGGSPAEAAPIGPQNNFVPSASIDPISYHPPPSATSNDVPPAPTTGASNLASFLSGLFGSDSAEAAPAGPSLYSPTPIGNDSVSLSSSPQPPFYDGRSLSPPNVPGVSAAPVPTTRMMPNIMTPTEPISLPANTPFDPAIGPVPGQFTQAAPLMTGFDDATHLGKAADDIIASLPPPSTAPSIYVAAPKPLPTITAPKAQTAPATATQLPTIAAAEQEKPPATMLGEIGGFLSKGYDAAKNAAIKTWLGSGPVQHGIIAGAPQGLFNWNAFNNQPGADYGPNVAAASYQAALLQQALQNAYGAAYGGGDSMGGGGMYGSNNGGSYGGYQGGTYGGYGGGSLTSGTGGAFNNR